MAEPYRKMLDLAQSAIEHRDQAFDELRDALDGKQQREPIAPNPVPTTFERRQGGSSSG